MHGSAAAAQKCGRWFCWSEGSKAESIQVIISMDGPYSSNNVFFVCTSAWSIHVIRYILDIYILHIKVTWPAGSSSLSVTIYDVAFEFCLILGRVNLYSVCLRNHYPLAGGRWPTVASNVHCRRRRCFLCLFVCVSIWTLRPLLDSSLDS